MTKDKQLMQEQTVTVAVIDFGSTHIKAALAEKYNQDKNFKIIASGQEPTEGCIRRGVIFNLNDTAQKVQALLSILEQKSGKKIRNIYAVVGGQSLHSHTYVVELPYETPQEITAEDLGTLLKEVDKFQHPDYVLLSEVYPRYYVNGIETQKPVGVQALQLKAEYQLILSRPEVTDALDTVLEQKLDYEVPELLIAPVVMARNVLTPEQMRIGCALVDFGGACTTVSIYRNGVLSKLRVIPIGSQSITSDLTRLYISPAEAERVKCEHGSVQLPDPREQKTVEVLSSDMISHKKVHLYKVNQYIEARAKEIIDNIRAVIKGNDHHIDLPGGLVLTGGGAKLNGFKQKLSHELGVEVELISDRVALDRVNEKYIANPEWHLIYSMIPFAVVACDESDQEQETINLSDTPTEQVAQGASDGQTTVTSGVKMPEQNDDFPEDDLPKHPHQPPLIPQEEQDELIVLPPEPEVKYNARKGKEEKKKKKKGVSLFDRLIGLLPTDDSYTADEE